MPRAPWWPIAALTLAAGCAGGGETPQPPLSPVTGAGPVASGARLGGQTIDGDLGQSALALFTVTVDPGTQSATARLKQTRSGQQTDDLYQLSIGNFITDSTLTVHSVEVNPQSVELHYGVTHPFKAPTDLDGLPTRTNRADLAVSGRVVFLADVATAAGNTFFEGHGTVVANTGVVTNADGYYTPAGLLSLPGYTANTFPYKVLVDETLDPRVSQADGLPRSNGGAAIGNYHPSYGWQRDTMGALNDGWTGYGVLHQGQTAYNTVTIDRATLSDGGRFSFDAAIIVKYVDPRGGFTSKEKRGNRLPPTSPNLAKFVYRMPHGALDVERVTFAGEGGTFVANQVSASDLRFRVVDFDARAAVTAAPDLSEDFASASTVAPGEPGAPALAVCIPGVLGGPDTVAALSPAAQVNDDTLIGGDLTPDSGLPGDGLYYKEAVTKLVTSGQTAGTYLGMVRATDVEAGGQVPIASLTEDLIPVTANPPRPEAYQTFRVNLAEPGPDPNAAPSLVLTTPANVPSGSGTSISVSNYNDADGDPITVEIDWNNDGTYDETKILAGGSGGGQTWISPSAYVNSTAVTQGRTIPVRYTDGLIAESIVYNPPLAFLLGPNEAPSPGSVVLSTPATVPNGSTTTVSVVSASDAEGDPIQFAIDWDNNPATPADLQTLQAPYTPVTYTSPIVFTGSVPNEGRNIPVTYADPAHAPVAYTPTLAFTLTGPVGSLPQVSLSTPTSVLSGNTAAITVQAANDADGNVIQLTIDWDNNPSTPADVRTIAPPYNTPLTYTSPTPYNNASLSPAGRGIPVTVSDGVNPPVAYAPSLGFTLSANRAPVITGAPALAVNPLPSPATFTMAAGNATAVDPEGDAISYTIANSVNTNTYSGSAFPIGGLGPFTGSNVIFTTYANDPLHPGTTGTAYPTATGLIQCSMLVNATFDTGLDGFILGQNFTPALYNTDANNLSQFQRCAVLPYMGPGFSGSCLTTGGDAGVCGNGTNTYGNAVSNNLVSPAFSLVGHSNARLYYNAVRNGKLGSSSCRFRVYISTNNGNSWNQIVNDLGGDSIPNTVLNREVSLASYAGQANVRLRFEFWDNGNSGIFTSAAGTYAGWSLDNVRVYSCP